MSVRRCRREVDRREFIEWVKFDELEPGLGEDRDDWRLAQLNATIVNTIHGVLGVKGGPATAADFMYESQPRRQEPTKQDIERSVYRLKVWRQRRQAQSK